ncbi:MAG: class II glutamine amidotransferase [Proteobacteria bacterium]|nr:class II glutamine amidotransferase [Pseudomonadota bacterium]
MCRLFGFRSAVPSRAHRSLIEAENALATQATQHPHGWGIGYFVGRDAYILKSADAAHTSERFRLASSRLKSHTFVVHVRRATVGVTDYLNSHPFRYGRWVFAHNGTIFDFDRIRDWMLEQIPEDRRMLILGTTDSEHLFHYMLSALERAGVDTHGHETVHDTRAAAAALRDAVDRLYAKTQAVEADDHPVVNFILTNGDAFFAQRAGKKLYLATQKTACADFETCPAEKVCMLPARPHDKKVNHMLVSSEQIGDEDRWELIAQGGLVYLSEGYDIGFLPPCDHFGLSRIAE